MPVWFQHAAWLIGQPGFLIAVVLNGSALVLWALTVRWALKPGRGRRAAALAAAAFAAFFVFYVARALTLQQRYAQGGAIELSLPD